MKSNFLKNLTVLILVLGLIIFCAYFVNKMIALWVIICLGWIILLWGVIIKEQHQRWRRRVYKGKKVKVLCFSRNTERRVLARITSINPHNENLVRVKYDSEDLLKFKAAYGCDGMWFPWEVCRSVLYPVNGCFKVKRRRSQSRS